ncbi:hypothetical protein KHA90_16240 [Flavobacterium psychroterrae]|jgi:hypothetical protein|uniref:Lipoprotein n=1 Tax=Flavobacterium psychroterrae TaxID=2133767 RepID=A0ABS5PE62_9FLAO|nr:hypothetical protein [Flavobacterium psychroterrae]MBS7232569.1 hypothetical protein [Flavobacterium psychroterrae]
MKSIPNFLFILFLILSFSACANKEKPVEEKESSETDIALQTNQKEESMEGFYETQPDENNTGECKISVEIKKEKNGYSYFLKTNLRKLKGNARFTTNESGEKYIVLEGIKWDEFEGDISHEEESDSITDSETKELEIPTGINAGYVKDTLTIQNYGNAMNSYTKISECGRKYIQLIKK